MAENVLGLVLLLIHRSSISNIRKSVPKNRVYCVNITKRCCFKLIKAGTIHYLSDGLETLHYYTRENSTIIVTPGSVPGSIATVLY